MTDMLPVHYNCRCTFVAPQAPIDVEVRRILEGVCLITPRSYDVVIKLFNSYLPWQPYDALDLARICYTLALADAPLPWEPGYEKYALEGVFEN